MLVEFLAKIPGLFVSTLFEIPFDRIVAKRAEKLIIAQCIVQDENRLVTYSQLLLEVGIFLGFGPDDEFSGVDDGHIKRVDVAESTSCKDELEEPGILHCAPPSDLGIVVLHAHELVAVAQPLELGRHLAIHL